MPFKTMLDPQYPYQIREMWVLLRIYWIFLKETLCTWKAEPGNQLRSLGENQEIACEWELAMADWNLGVRAERMESLLSDLGAIFWLKNIVYDGQAVEWNSAGNIELGLLNIQKSSNFRVYKNHTSNLFKMQIPCPEFLALYIKGRNQEYVFLIRTSRWLCLRNLVVEITCLKQLLTTVRKLSGVRHPRPLSCKVSCGRPEVVSVLFPVSKAY